MKRMCIVLLAVIFMSPIVLKSAALADGDGAGVVESAKHKKAKAHIKGKKRVREIKRHHKIKKLKHAQHEHSTAEHSAPITKD